MSGTQTGGSKKAALPLMLGVTTLGIALLIVVVVGGQWVISEIRGVVKSASSVGDDKDLLPTVSRTHQTNKRISSVAATDTNGVWAYGCGGLGTSSGVTVLQGDAWRFAGELEPADYVFDVKDDYNDPNTSPGNWLHNLREGAEDLHYVRSRDCFIWVSEYTCRLIASGARVVNYATGSSIDSYGRGVVLTRLPATPGSLAVSSDGVWVAVGMSATVDYPSDDAPHVVDPHGGEVLLFTWDSERCTLLKSIGFHDGSVRACAFSSDDKFLVTGGNDGVVRVWSVPDGNLVEERDVGGPVLHVSATKGASKVAYCGERGNVAVLDRSSGTTTELHSSDLVPPPSDGIRSIRPTCCSYSFEDKWLAVYEDHRLRVYRTSDLSLMGARKLEGAGIRALSWSPNSRFLGVAFEDQAHLLEVKLGD